MIYCVFLIERVVESVSAGKKEEAACELGHKDRLNVGILEKA